MSESVPVELQLEGTFQLETAAKALEVTGINTDLKQDIELFLDIQDENPEEKVVFTLASSEREEIEDVEKDISDLTMSLGVLEAVGEVTELRVAASALLELVAS